MEHAVTKPIVRRGVAASTERASAMVVIVRSTIPELSESRFFSELHSSA
jgi:hypothetical protein